MNHIRPIICYLDGLRGCDGSRSRPCRRKSASHGHARSFKSLLQRRIQPGSSEAYVLATLCVVIASLLRWALGWIPDPISAFPTYYPAVFLHHIISAELGPYDTSRIDIEGPDTFLSPKLALTVALLFHELATNAAKYGALSKPAGRLSVVWLVSEGRLRLNWRETGGPTVCAPNHRGFGMRLLSGALDQIDGKLNMCFDPAGLRSGGMPAI